jgi:hypothetical protein
LPHNVPLPSPSDFNTGDITLRELIDAAWRSPAGKAFGMDQVPNEVLRIPSVAKAILRVMNVVLNSGEVPREWLQSQIVAIPKKPGTTKIEEHRGISLMSCTAKLFNKILLHRIQSVLDKYLRKEQNGFRPHRGTITQILALRRLIEEAEIHKKNLIITFVDFSKAFDSVHREAIPRLLAAYNVPQKLANAVYSLYKNTTACVLTSDGPTDMFTTSSGVLQGDTLSPFLFVIAVDWILQNSIPSNDLGFITCPRLSSRYPEKRISVLAYADDLALTASDAHAAQTMVDCLCNMAATLGLQINASKTEVLTIPENMDIHIYCSTPDGRECLPKCRSFRYLGGIVPNVRDDISRRKALAWASVIKLTPIWNSSLDSARRSMLFHTLVDRLRSSSTMRKRGRYRNH